MRFSVLMSLYAKESPIYLNQAFASLAESTVAPDEVVVVLDGPVGSELTDVLEQYSAVLPIKQVPLSQNIGLGPALNQGLAVCRNEWVARFDTDDINELDRFAKQVAFIETHPEVDILGGTIVEFDSDPQSLSGSRQVPEKHEDIVQFAKRRSPFNHMTVMYRKSKVIACDAYGAERRGQDYSLWVRMLLSGARAANLPDVLVRARAGDGMLARRGGWKYAVIEARAQYAFLRQGFLNPTQFLFNVGIRVPVRLCPASVRGFAYRLLRNR